MKPRLRPLSHLFHRWGRHVALDAETCALALTQAGIIQRIDATHYRENERDRSLPLSAYEQIVRDVLLTYKAQHSEVGT